MRLDRDGWDRYCWDMLASGDDSHLKREGQK